MIQRSGRSLTTWELASVIVLSLSAMTFLGYWFVFMGLPQDFYRQLPRESVLCGFGVLAGVLALVFRSPVLMAGSIGVANGFMGWWIPLVIGRSDAGYAPAPLDLLGALIEIGTALLIFGWLVGQFVAERWESRSAVWWVIAQIVALVAAVVFSVRLGVVVFPPASAPGPAPVPWLVLGVVVPLLFCLLSLRAPAAVSGAFVAGTCLVLLAGDWTMTRPGFFMVEIGVGFTFWASALPLLVAIGLGVAAGALFRRGAPAEVLGISEFGEPIMVRPGDGSRDGRAGGVAP